MKNFTKAIKPAFIMLFLGIMTLNAHSQSGNTLDFDGINDYVEIPYNSAVLPQIISVQLYVKLNSTTPSQQPIFSNGGADVSGNYSGFGLFAVNGFWTILYGNGANAPVPLVGPAIIPGVWINIAGTYDGTTLSLYINGSLFTSVVPSPKILSNFSFPIRLGAWPANPPVTFFGGQIDELSMWSGVLTPAQIAANMNGGLNPSQANLLAYYNFNEGIANGNNNTPILVNKLNDATSNGNDGTLNNFALNGNTSNWVSVSVVLPINLINFSGTKKDGYNLLQWSTASEQNSSYFEVQRSENGTDFSTIAKVTAAGNSSIVKNYQYSDDQISSSSLIYYYRLKMVDIDGSGKYSSIIFIRNSVNGLTTVYPNPAINQITINVADQSLINTQVIMTDLSGKVLQRISLNQTTTQVDISNFAKGMYILKFTNGSSIKIVKE